MGATTDAAAFRATVEEQSGGCWLVVLCGELDLETAPSCAETFQSVSASAASIRVDLSQVDFVDSAGLKSLLLLQRAHPGAVTLVHPRPALVRLLEITNLSDIFTLD